MNWFNNLRTGVKISLLGAGAIIALGIIAVIGYMGLEQSSDSTEKMYSQNLLAVQFINNTRSQSHQIEADIYGLMNTEDPDAEQK
ncbi:MCP four helix bundle domain-containing protein [Pectinatus brassicae]|uniref:Chemotaxis methyl-accepting receptor HlyB-like 4HB MCP domain-containing protein n=1 Tax=Pectinatus brassicae TaxID=862415 RepID=A0A840UR46_9FIRM|nr:MCP four helix bundle domain-containing protein [Pectinatus brassicae]MBB5335304.1 hypothetical protein [Pectinatus brassicae]